MDHDASRGRGERRGASDAPRSRSPGGAARVLGVHAAGAVRRCDRGPRAAPTRRSRRRAEPRSEPCSCSSAAVEAVVSPLAGRFSDRAGRMTPIRAGLIGAAVMAVLLPLPETAVLVGLGDDPHVRRPGRILGPGHGAPVGRRRGRMGWTSPWRSQSPTWPGPSGTCSARVSEAPWPTRPPMRCPTQRWRCCAASRSSGYRSAGAGARRSAPSRSWARARCRSGGTASARACPAATRARRPGRPTRPGCATSRG